MSEKENGVYVILSNISHMMEYYSAIKNNKILPLETAWMETEDIRSNEIIQIWKGKYHMFSLMRKPKTKLISEKRVEK
jgi:hypothetical protein